MLFRSKDIQNLNLIENEVQRPLPDALPEEEGDQLEGILQEIGIEIKNEEEEVDADMFELVL